MTTSTGNQRFRVAVLLSGTGRTLENLLACRARGELNIDIVGVVSSRAGVRGLEIAQSAGLRTHVVSRAAVRDPGLLSAEVRAFLAPTGVDLIALAGFLRQMEILPEWRARVINIHPSLLPLFGGKGMYGGRVHEAVLASGMKVSGCTVHVVDEEYDAGPIILQLCVPVADDDDAHSLGERVFAAECRAYPDAIRLFQAGRLRVDGRRVYIVARG
jgi:formyltetrahydrofolate-dependent phosphoribosylglycinamide formyltransferase